MKIAAYKEKYQKLWMLPSLFFALFNLGLGLYSHSIYSYSIAIYYLCLFLLRLLVNVKKNKKRIYSFYLLLFLLDIALIIPIVMMLYQQKEIHFGLIIAITMATYTTYKATLTGMYIYKHRKENETSVRMKMIIHIVDAAVSIINLQYALIIVNGGFEGREDMSILSLISSLAIFLFIIVISCYFFKKEKNNLKEKEYQEKD